MGVVGGAIVWASAGGSKMARIRNEGRIEIGTTIAESGERTAESAQPFELDLGVPGPFVPSIREKALSRERISSTLR